MTREALAAIGKAREEFLALVDGVRPELHRYCARLTGSVIEGEDIVQETLARAFYALGANPELPPLRPWLFRIAHNAALDLLKSHGRARTEPRDDLADLPLVDEPADPWIVRAALARFLALPVVQRSAVILKDVLDHSLEEAAETMDSTVPAVKAALVRGRARLREAEVAEVPVVADDRAALDRYASLFNARDWDGLRALVADDCRLDLVARAQRRGKAVGQYFDRYAREDVALRVVALEGRLALAAHVAGAARPAYVVLLAWRDGRVAAIRDFRYVPYIAAEAELGAVGSSWTDGPPVHPPRDKCR
jgi:RNA polymerase sigma-70 factor (ECF subfamily)